MGIIGDLIRGAKTVANNVKGIFTQKPTTVTPQKTLNEEIETPTQVGSFPNTSISAGVVSNSALQNLINQNTATLSAPTTETQRRANIWARNNIDNFNVDGDKLSIAEQLEEEAEGGLGKKISNITDWISNAYTRYDANERYKNEVKANSQDILLSYNPNTTVVTKLVPRDEGTFNARLNQFNSEYETATTPEEQQRARQSFYDDMKESGFKAEDATQGFHKYPDDVLSSVSGNVVKRGTYPVSEEEFRDYVSMVYDNYETQRNIYDKYKEQITAGLDDEDLEEAEYTNEFKQNFSDIAKKDTLDLINRNVTSSKRGEAVRNVDEIVSDPADRLLTSEMYLKRLRDEAAQTPELQRTQWQRDMIYNYDVVWKQLMEQYASNVNDYLMLQLTEGVDDKGDISDALWKFEDGSRLNDILRNRLDEIAGIDIKGLETFGKVSALDIMRRFANEAAYEYNQGKAAQDDAWIKSAWNTMEHGLEPVGEQRAEASQSVWRLGTKLTNTVSSVFQGRRGWNSPASAYWDADFSVGKLIETDDSPSKRTIKKYGLQFGEYIPEGVGAVAPDILLTYATAGGSAPSLLRSVGTFSRRVQNFAKVQSLLKKSNAAARAVNSTLKGMERVGEIGKNLGNINSWEKRVLNIADRTLSQFAVGQSMDAKLSAFDTEPYSDTSFWLSMGGSLLGDILPEAKDIWGIMRTGVKGGKAWTKGTGVWDLVDFINQSDENAMLIARQMGKNTAEFSEQDLKNYIRAYATITEAAKRVYENLPDEAKAVANEWTKELMYNFVKQAYLPNSRVGKAVRAMVQNKATNPADIIKYVGGIPGTVSIGPYQSRIKLKQGTLAGVRAKNGGWYDVALDVIDGGFGNKVSKGFTLKDIQDISKIDRYSDILKNKDKYFREVIEKAKAGDKEIPISRRVLSEDGLERFGLEAKNLTLASLGIEISGAENVKEIFKEKMKGLEGMKLSNDTIDALAENGGYNEVVSKIENILC